MSTRHRPTYLFLLTLGMLTLAVYGPLYFGTYTLTGSTADLICSAFSHMAEAFQQGTFPLWNKYQLQGLNTSIFPVYWNPVYLVLALLFSSPGIALNALHLFLIFVSGLGFYKWAGSYLKNKNSVFLAGLIYPLIGFFTTHGTDLNVINTAAWMPVLLYSHRSYLRKGTFRYGAILGLSFYLFATATSPGLVLAGGTLLLAQTMMWSPHDHNRGRHRRIYALCIPGLSGFLVWKIYLIRWRTYDYSAEFIPAPTTLSHFFQDMVGLALPKTPALEANLSIGAESGHHMMHIGILLIIMTVFTGMHRPTRTDRRLGLAAFIFLGLTLMLLLLRSFTTGGTSVITTEALVGFKFFFVGALIVLGLRGLDKSVKPTTQSKLPFLFLISGGLAVGTALVLKLLNPSGLPFGLQQTDLWKSVSFLLIASVVCFIRLPRWRWIALASLILVELGINQESYLSTPNLIGTTTERPHATAGVSNGIIELHQPVGKFRDSDFSWPNRQRNIGTLTRTLVKDGYWPWRSDRQTTHMDTPDHNAQLRYPLFYLSRDTTGSATPIYTHLQEHITILSHSDHHWELSFLNQYEKFLILNQNYHKDWIAYIDQERVPVHPTDTGMMKIAVKPGLHTATFLFRSDGLLHLFGVTMVVILLMVIFMISTKTFPLSAFGPGIPILMVFVLNTFQNKPASKEKEPSREPADYVMNYESNRPFWFVQADQITPWDSFDGYRAESFDANAEYSATLQLHRSALKGKTALGYRFRLKAAAPVDVAVVAKTYSQNDESYNIHYLTSLDTDKWHTLEGQFSLQEPEPPLVKTEFYLWNYKEQDFLIDDIEIKLSP